MALRYAALLAWAFVHGFVMGLFWEEGEGRVYANAGRRCRASRGRKRQAAALCSSCWVATKLRQSDRCVEKLRYSATQPRRQDVVATKGAFKYTSYSPNQLLLGVKYCIGVLKHPLN